MPYLEQTTENDWCKRLFDSLRTIESKLDQLLVMKEQSVDTTIHPPLKPEYLDIIDVSKILKVEQKTIYNWYGQERSHISKRMVDCCFFVTR